METRTAALDALSVAALDYATAWVLARHGVKPQCSVVLRRALAVYVDSLDRITPDMEAAEMYALKAAGHGTGNAQSLAEARGRLEKAGSFKEMRYTAEEIRQQAQLMARLETLP